MLDTIRTLYNFFLSFDVEIVAKTSQRWLRMFTDLVERGLKYPLIVVSDDIGGITEVIKTIFPKANQQICLVHLRWNARCYMSCKDYKDFKNAISQIKLCSVLRVLKNNF